MLLARGAEGDWVSGWVIPLRPFLVAGLVFAVVVFWSFLLATLAWFGFGGLRLCDWSSFRFVMGCGLCARLAGFCATDRMPRAHFIIPMLMQTLESGHTSSCSSEQPLDVFTSLISAHPFPVLSFSFPSWAGIFPVLTNGKYTSGMVGWPRTSPPLFRSFDVLFWFWFDGVQRVYGAPGRKSCLLLIISLSVLFPLFIGAEKKTFGRYIKRSIMGGERA